MNIQAVLWLSGLVRVDFQYSSTPNCVYEVVEKSLWPINGQYVPKSHSSDTFIDLDETD